MKILIINGPNLNLLGKRQVEIYGDKTEWDLKRLIAKYTAKRRINVEIVQSNHEGQIIDWIQTKQYDGLIINPAAYAHTSIAILDALLAVDKPKIEVHLTNIDDREEYRRVKITAKGVDRMICGKHFAGYLKAIDIIEAIILRFPEY